MFWATRSDVYRVCVGGIPSALWMISLGFWGVDLKHVATGVGDGDLFGLAIIVVTMIPAMAVGVVTAVTLENTAAATILGVFLIASFTMGLHLASAEGSERAGGSPEPVAEAEPYVAPVTEQPVVQDPEGCESTNNDDPVALGARFCVGEGIEDATVYEFPDMETLSAAYRRSRPFRDDLTTRIGRFAMFKIGSAPAAVVTDRRSLELVVVHGQPGRPGALGEWIAREPWTA
jgi:hypothetical protein